MTSPVLEMSNVSKTFGSVKALSNVQLTLYPGEVHALARVATDDDAPPDELADYPDEPEEDAPEGRSLRKDADEMPPHPAVPYVKRAPRDTEAVEEVINPDMRPIEPAQVKPPRSRNV